MTRLTWPQIQTRALAFSKRWEKASSEKSHAQTFVKAFLHVFGVEDAEHIGLFEYKVPVDDGKGFIDYFWKNKIAIEMKSKGENLKKAYEQLKNYVVHLRPEEMPELLMVCDFEKINLYYRSTGKKYPFSTKKLKDHVTRFASLAGRETTRTYDDQVQANVKAAEKMAKLHDELKKSGYDGHNLEVYLVRLLFCMFADSTRIFPNHNFINYIENSKKDGSDLSGRIGKLFEVLNRSDNARKKFKNLSDDLLEFRYINGGLFEKLLPTADFDAKMRDVLLECANFDWKAISPAIFGAMFQGVMDEKQRRELGAHYTSEENILKLIKPLFWMICRKSLRALNASLPS